MRLANFTWLHNSMVRSTYVRSLKFCRFVTLRHSLPCPTGQGFGAKLLKYSSVHICLIFVWANVMIEYAGTYKLYNNEDMGAIFLDISYF